METSITRECAGLLFGYKTEEKYYFGAGDSFQIAQRKSDAIIYYPLKPRRFFRVIDDYLECRIIGEYHSHPEGKSRPSRDDISYFTRGDYPIEIIIASGGEGISTLSGQRDNIGTELAAESALSLVDMILKNKQVRSS